MWSGDQAHIQHAEGGSASRTGTGAPHPATGVVLWLPAGKPFTHAVLAPHGTTVALPAGSLLPL